MLSSISASLLMVIVIKLHGATVPITANIFPGRVGHYGPQMGLGTWGLGRASRPTLISVDPRGGHHVEAMNLPFALGHSPNRSVSSSLSSPPSTSRPPAEEHSPGYNWGFEASAGPPMISHLPSAFASEFRLSLPTVVYVSPRTHGIGCWVANRWWLG